MEVVLRPVSDAFLTQVIFPSFELGVLDGEHGIDHLLQFVHDAETAATLESVKLHLSGGSFFGLDDERWNQAIYTLLFRE